MLRSNGMPTGLINRQRTSPIPVNRTTRPLIFRNLTSLNAGKVVPIAVIPLLREDSCQGRFRVQFKMDETVEILMNSVNVRVMAYLVPKLAFDRFTGLDDINRSYENESAGINGGTVPPWFEPYTAPADPKTNEIFWSLGKHYAAGATLNTDYIEAYNRIWNFRAKNRSPKLTQRARLDVTLAPSFWEHQTFAHIVPDFDQAIIDGEVPLNIVGGKLPITPDGSLGYPTFKTPDAGGTYNLRMDSADQNVKWAQPALTGAAHAPMMWHTSGLVAELSAAGTTISLSNIELARKTQAFANLRRQYAGHSDEYIINLLMDGIEIPDEAWKQPMLLADVSTVFGMAKRWATDGASLTESVVNGATFVDLAINCPRVGPGGVIMITAEIAPEQLFERQKDVYLHTTDVAKLPHFLRDTLDPEKVEVVTNDYVDVLHASPTATFGYAPLNHAWAKSAPQVGGRYTRPADDASFDEARQRIWAVETADPVLGTDFYLVTHMHYKPFVVTDEQLDHFESLLSGACTIRGNTVFGSLLIESTDDYDKVLAVAPQDRIQKPASMEFERAEPPPADSNS